MTEPAQRQRPVLRKGDRGEDVALLQERLRALGDQAVTVDGDFGPQLEAAVLAFQRRYGTSDDGAGVAGELTLRRIAEVLDPSRLPGQNVENAPPGSKFEPGAPATEPSAFAANAGPSRTGFESSEAAASEPLPARPSMRVLADFPVEDEANDLLGFGLYADALAGLINHPGTSTPLTMAINAPWGAGKSTLARLLIRRLAQRPSARGVSPHVVCEFNAWMHDDADNIGTAFAAEVSRAANRRRAWWRRLLWPLPPTIRPRADALWLNLVVVAVVLALAGALTIVICRLLPRATWIPGVLEFLGLEKALELLPRGGVPQASEFWTTLLGAGGLSLFALLFGKLREARESLSAFFKDPVAAAQAGSLTQVRGQLGRLIRHATPSGSRFVIVVDDLERCRPARSVDLLEVVNQLLAHPEVVTIILADLPAVAACANIKYGELAKLYVPAAGLSGAPVSSDLFGRLYLQKIIQLQFDLPPHDPEMLKELVRRVAADPAAAKAAAPRDHERLAHTGAREMLANVVRLPPWDEWAAERRVLRSMFARYVTGPLRAVLWLSGTALRQFGLETLFGVPGRNQAGADILFASRRWTTRYVVARLTVLVALGWAGWAIVSALRAHAPLRPHVWLPLVAVLLAAEALAQWFARMRGRVLTLEARSTIEREGETSSPAELVDRLAQLSPYLPRERVAELVQERRILRQLEDSPLLESAYEEVFRFLPQLPRNAKRTVNHLRLALFIAHGRSVFGGQPPLTPRHIGKWIAMRERWPELAQALVQRHEAMASLEWAAVAEQRMEFFAAVRSLVKEHPEDPELLEFFKTTDVPMAGVFERLVYHHPAVTSG